VQEIIEASTRGDPCSCLLWTSKSTYKIAEELNKEQYRAGRKIVGRILKSLDYSLQGNKKTDEGSSHPDRDQQFQYINEKAKLFQTQGNPVLSYQTANK